MAALSTLDNVKKQWLIDMQKSILFVLFWITKLDAGLTPSLPASDPDSTAARSSKKINPSPVCVRLGVNAFSKNDDDDDDIHTKACFINFSVFV